VFYTLFDIIENTNHMKSQYKFFYFRTSPRGNNKFGVCDIPWQRLRMQQQGTDEEIFFDHLYILKSDRSYSLLDVERYLKKSYKTQCLAENNKRAGHTEWFSKIDIKDFDKKIKKIAEMCGVEIRKLKLKTPYSATKKSQCPFDSPKTYTTAWYDEFWRKIGR